MKKHLESIKLALLIYNRPENFCIWGFNETIGTELPIGLESSLKLDNWMTRPRCEKFRISSRNVGSPSLSVLWITTSVFSATYTAEN